MWAATLLAAPATWAEPTAAVYPLVIRGASDGDAAKLEKVPGQVLQSIGYRVVSTDESRDFQAKHPSDDCMNQALCLSDFAKASKTDTGWIITVVPFAGPKRMFLTVAAERSDGVVLASARKVSVIRGPKETRSEALQRALLRIAQEAKEKSNELTSLVPTVKPAPVEPKVTPPNVALTQPRPAVTSPIEPNPRQPVPEPVAPPNESASGWKLPVGIGLGVVGVAGIVAGVYFQAQSNTALTTFESYYQGAAAGHGPPASQKPQVQAAYKAITSNQTISDVGWVGGGVALAAGAAVTVFYVMTRPESPPGPHASLVLSPSFSGIVGTF